MRTFEGETTAPHGETPATGVLVANLGTPDAPTTPALKRYLKQFLSDPRVIELSKARWWPILNLIVLPRRSPKSAEAYREVWTDEGSPLLLISRKQVAGIAERLERRLKGPVHVELGMRYGNPSIGAALRKLTDKRCRRVLLLPLYPQYSATTSASTFDAMADALKKMRWIPEFRWVQAYHDDVGYIGAVAQSLRDAWAEQPRGKRLLFSFHGIPKRYFLAGDPYYCHCQKTARLVAEELGLEDGTWLVSFQSRFGREEWLQPYTDETLKAWGAEKLESVDVVCPGFSADCLETIEEIDQENREYFEEAGGGAYRYIAALNDRTDHLDALAAVAERHLRGWPGVGDQPAPQPTRIPEEA